MLTSPAQPVRPAVASGYWVEILTGCALLFVLQSGLMPFDFVSYTGAGRPGSFFDASRYDLIVPDIVSNLALYFPLGALVCWTLDRRVAGGVLAAGAAILFCAFVSVGIEYAQAFSPSRVSSLIDLTSNVLGASIGASCSWVARRVLPKFAAATMLELRVRPQATALKAYCAALIVSAAVPFSFSFDFGGLKTAIKSANFVPFASAGWAGGYLESSAIRTALGAAPASSARLAPDPPTAPPKTTEPLGSSAYATWFAARRWSRWAAEAASFFLLAALLLPVLRQDYGFTRTASVVLSIWASILLACLLSVMQLFIISRGCDVTDVLFRVVGVALGLFVWSPGAATEDGTMQKRIAAASREPGRWRRLAQLGCIGTAMYILYTGVIPLTYTWDWALVAKSVSAPEFMPFFAYFTGRFDLMLADFIEKLTAYALFAALFTAVLRQDRSRSIRARLGSALAVCLPLALVIEALQMFNPIRVTSLTDPFVAVVGVVLGVLAQDQVLQFYRHAQSLTLTGSPAARIALPAATTLSPLEELISTLAEPHAGAPTEPHGPLPAPKPTPRE